MISEDQLDELHIRTLPSLIIRYRYCSQHFMQLLNLQCSISVPGSNMSVQLGSLLSISEREMTADALDLTATNKISCLGQRDFLELSLARSNADIILSFGRCR